MNWSRVARALLISCLIFGGAGVPGRAVAQTTGSALVIVASKSVVVSGEQVQLSAVILDDSGHGSPASNVLWNSSDVTMAAIDSNGVVSTSALGTALVFATTVDGLRSQDLLLQVIPSKIEVTAPHTTLSVGDTVQLTARALDANGVALNSAAIQWGVSGNGSATTVASIDNNGLLKATALGIVTVRAFVKYDVVANGPSSFNGFLDLSIIPTTDYRLTRLAATDPLHRSFQLRPNYVSGFAVNDSGQIAFVAAWDGLASGLMLYSNGRFDVLAGAGTPAFSPGNFIFDFETPAINNNGQVLTRVYAPITGLGSGLMLASRSGNNMIRLEGSTQPGFGNMNNFKTSRYSLNDGGDIVFLSDYTDIPATSRTGLFKQSAAVATLLISAGDELPGIGAGTDISQDFFGIDGAGTIYFVANSGSDSALYRVDGTQGPRKIVGTGDSEAGSSIAGLSGFAVSQGGLVAMAARLANGAQLLLKYSGSTGVITTWSIPAIGQIYSINNAGDILLQGDSGSGWGLIRFSADGGKPVMLIGQSRFDNGQSITGFRDAAVTAQGDVYTIASSADNDYIFTQGSAARRLFQAGQRVDLQLNLNFVGFVGNSHAGVPNLFTGGGNASIYQAGATGLEPIWISGDRVWPGTSSGPLTAAARSPSGILYFMTAAGIARYGAGNLQPVLRFPFDLTTNLSEVTTVYGGAAWYDRSNFLAANDDEKLAFAAITASNLVLLTSDRGKVSKVITFGSANGTAPLSGGIFAGLASTQGRQPGLAIDDSGRIMINAYVAGGSSGLFLFDNGLWQPAALLNDDRTIIDGLKVIGVWSFRASGDAFYAILVLNNGGMVVAQYRGGVWQTLIRSLDALPDGLELNGLSAAFDVNRRGDIAFAALANEMSIVVRMADGTNHLVSTTGSSTPDGDLFGFQSFDLDLREDGRLYFIGIDLFDRNLLYLAEPVP